MNCSNFDHSFLLQNDVLLFQGTNIAAGKAKGVVCGTGLNTEIGM